MQIKTFKGFSTQEVLKKIKESLGENAVILNSTTEIKNGKKIYQVMAAVDNSFEEEEERLLQENTKDGSKDIGEKWYVEWNHFKEQIYSLLKNSMDLPCLSSRQQAAIRHLEMEGVGEDFIVNLLALLRRNGSSFMDLLGRMVPLVPWGDEPLQGKCHIFVGPHGVGKTSIILKLALKYKREHPGAKICLVNVDNYQGKGKMFLKHYAGLSDFSYREIEGLKEGAALLGEVPKFDIMFIDTPGLPRGMDFDTWWSSSPVKLLEGARVHLVLSPVYSLQQIQYYLNKFQDERISSVVWTKLDEACIYGTMLYTSFKTGLPISLFSYGATLKNSLAVANRALLWNLVFKHRLPNSH